MAHVSDRWHRTIDGVKVRSERYGSGKRWQAAWRDPATYQERTKAFDRRVDADTFAAAVETDQVRGTYVDLKAGRVRFDEYAKRWQAIRRANPSTLDREAIVLRVSLLPFFGAMPMGDIRPSDVKAWAKARGTKVAESTLRVEASSLKQILDMAEDDRVIGASPWRKLSTPDAPDRRPTWRTVWGVADVLDIAQAHPEPLRPLVRLAAGTGIRQGEAFGVDVDAINRRWRLLHVRHQIKRVGNTTVLGLPKRGQVRDVPLAGPLLELLGEHLEAHPPVTVRLPWERPDGDPVTVSLLFAGGRGAPLRRDDFDRKWRAALRTVGIVPDGKTTGMHQLRHHYASLLIKAREDVRVVAALLGHTPVETLGTYSHMFNDEVDRTADIVAAAHFGDSLADQRRTKGHLRDVSVDVSAGQGAGGGRVGL